MAAMDSGIVNTTWKYSQGRRCCCCASSQRAFANDWHFVQWRLRHELNEMRVCEYEGFADGSWLRANREASKARDHQGVPQVQEVKLSDADERSSKGGY